MRHTICRMISCSSRSPIKHSLIMFAHCMKFQVISEKITGAENFQDPRSHLRTDSEHCIWPFFLVLTISISCALHFGTAKCGDCRSVNSQKTQDFCHHSDLLFECHFASTEERILHFLKSIGYFHAVSMAELAI